MNYFDNILNKIAYLSLISFINKKHKNRVPRNQNDCTTNSSLSMQSCGNFYKNNLNTWQHSVSVL